MKSILLVLSGLTITSCFKGFDFREKVGVGQINVNPAPVVAEQDIFSKILHADSDEGKIAEIMVAASAEDKAEALHRAVTGEQKNLLQLLLPYHNGSQEKRNGYTLLMAVVEGGNLEIFNSVIDCEIERGLLNALCEDEAPRNIAPGLVTIFKDWTALDFANGLVALSGNPNSAEYIQNNAANYLAIRDLLIEKGANTNMLHE